MSLDSTAAKSQRADAENPWLGPMPFTYESREYFHGRDDEADELFRRVHGDVLTVLFGRSGLGKSSLIQAALVPRLEREGYLAVLLRLDYKPEAEPIGRQVRRAFAAALESRGISGLLESSDEKSLWEFFHQRGLVLRSADGLPIIPVLVFDQFEELFTIGQNVNTSHLQTSRALERLADLVENRPPREVELALERDPSLAKDFAFGRQEYRVVLSLREDYLAHLESFSGRMPSVARNRMRLTMMTGLQAFAAVAKPGRSLLTDAVAEQIVLFVAGRPLTGSSESDPEQRGQRLAGLEIDPALLSMVCHELNKKRRSRGLPQITTDLFEGSRESILEDFYARSIADQPPAVGRFIEDELLLNNTAIRDSLAVERVVEELGKLGVPEPARVIEKLVERRLLRPEDRSGIRRVEIAHDVLARVVAVSRGKRQEIEAKLQAQQRQKEAEVQQQKAEARLLRSRRIGRVIIALCLLAVGASIFAGVAWKKARGALEKARESELALARVQDAARHMRSQADLAFARYARTEDPSTALARAGYAIRTDPANTLALEFASMLLRDRNWPFLIGEYWHHSEVCRFASFSPDGRRFVSCSYDLTAGVFDAATGEQIGEWMQHKRSPVCARFSPDGRRIVTTSTDFSAQIWTADGAPTGIVFLHKDRVAYAEFSPDGNWLVTVCSDGAARIWPAQGGAPAHEFRHGKNVTLRHAAFSPDGKLLATAGADSRACLWDIEKNARLPIEMRHDAQVQCVQFSPDGTRLGTASHDKTARVWDLATGQPIGEQMRHRDVLYWIEFSPDGHRVSTASGDRMARIWDAATGRPVSETLRHSQRVYVANFSPDGARILTASQDGIVRIWDVSPRRSLPEMLTVDAAVRSVEFSPFEEQVVLAACGSEARLIDFGAGQPVVRARFPHAGKVRSACFNTEGTRVVTASDDKTAQLWSAGGEKIGSPMGHDRGVRHAQFSGDGQRIITVDRERLNGAVRVWAAGNGQHLHEWSTKEAEIVAADFLPGSGAEALIVTTRGVLRWEIATGKTVPLPLAGVNPELLRCAQLSPDGTLLATGSGGFSARISKIATGEQVGDEVRHDGEVRSVRFSRDGRRLITSADDSTAQVWEVATGKPIGEPLGHGEVCSAAFRSDAQRVVTSSDFSNTAGVIRLWDSITATEPPAETEMRLLELAAAGGVKIGGDPNARQVLSSADEVRQLLAGPPAASAAPMKRFFAWLVMPPSPSRTVSPLSALTFDGWLQRQFAKGTVSDLRDAMLVDWNNAMLNARYAKQLATNAKSLPQASDPSVARYAAAAVAFYSERARRLARTPEEAERVRAELP